MIDESFAHNWRAEILAARPLILPRRHFTHPREAEEVERGAMEVLVHPFIAPIDPVLKECSGIPPFPQKKTERTGHGRTVFTGLINNERPPSAEEFLATCALGFRDPAVPTGLWSTPDPDWLCAVSGGYAYLINTTEPTEFVMIELRPVLAIVPVLDQQLLLFVGHTSIVAWGVAGEAWRADKLSDEGITVERIEDGVLHGRGWRMQTDREFSFELDVRSGLLRCK